MSDAEDPREALVRDALDAYKEEYRELSDTWRNLDTKAQGTITVSGLFLAAMLAFVRALSSTTTPTEKWLLTITAALLTCGIIFALLVLRIRSVSGAPIGEHLAKLIDDLLAAEDGTSAERLLDYCRDQSQMWNSTNREIEEVNKLKAGYLIRAQLILVAAIGIAAIVTLIRVWN